MGPRKYLKESCGMNTMSSDVGRTTDDVVKLILDCVEQIPALTDQLIQNILGTDAEGRKSEEVTTVQLETCSNQCQANIDRRDISTSNSSKHSSKIQGGEPRPKEDKAVEAQRPSIESVRSVLDQVEKCLELDSLKVSEETKDELRAAIRRIRDLLNEIKDDALDVLVNYLKQMVPREPQKSPTSCKAVERGTVAPNNSIESSLSEDCHIQDIKETNKQGSSTCKEACDSKLPDINEERTEDVAPLTQNSKIRSEDKESAFDENHENDQEKEKSADNEKNPIKKESRSLLKGSSSTRKPRAKEEESHEKKEQSNAGLTTLTSTNEEVERPEDHPNKSGSKESPSTDETNAVPKTEKRKPKKEKFKSSKKDKSNSDLKKSPSTNDDEEKRNESEENEKEEHKKEKSNTGLNHSQSTVEMGKEENLKGGDVREEKKNVSNDTMASKKKSNMKKTDEGTVKEKPSNKRKSKSKVMVKEPGDINDKTEQSEDENGKKRVDKTEDEEKSVQSSLITTTVLISDPPSKRSLLVTQSVERTTPMKQQEEDERKDESSTEVRSSKSTESVDPSRSGRRGKDEKSTGSKDNGKCDEDREEPFAQSRLDDGEAKSCKEKENCPDLCKVCCTAQEPKKSVTKSSSEDCKVCSSNDSKTNLHEEDKVSTEKIPREQSVTKCDAPDCGANNINTKSSVESKRDHKSTDSSKQSIAKCSAPDCKTSQGRSDDAKTKTGKLDEKEAKEASKQYVAECGAPDCKVSEDQTNHASTKPSKQDKMFSEQSKYGPKDGKPSEQRVAECGEADCKASEDQTNDASTKPSKQDEMGSKHSKRRLKEDVSREPSKQRVAKCGAPDCKASEDQTNDASTKPSKQDEMGYEQYKYQSKEGVSREPSKQYVAKCGAQDCKFSENQSADARIKPGRPSEMGNEQSKYRSKEDVYKQHVAKCGLPGCEGNEDRPDDAMTKLDRRDEGVKRAGTSRESSKEYVVKCGAPGCKVCSDKPGGTKMKSRAFNDRSKDEVSREPYVVSCGASDCVLCSGKTDSWIRASKESMQTKERVPRGSCVTKCSVPDGGRNEKSFQLRQPAAKCDGVASRTSNEGNENEARMYRGYSKQPVPTCRTCSDSEMDDSDSSEERVTKCDSEICKSEMKDCLHGSCTEPYRRPEQVRARSRRTEERSKEESSNIGRQVLDYLRRLYEADSRCSCSPRNVKDSVGSRSITSSRLKPGKPERWSNTGTKVDPKGLAAFSSNSSKVSNRVKSGTSCKACGSDTSVQTRSSRTYSTQSVNCRCGQPGVSSMQCDRRTCSRQSIPNSNCGCNMSETTSLISGAVSTVSDFLRDKCFRTFLGPSLDETAIAAYDTLPLLPAAAQNAKNMVYSLVETDEDY